MGKPFKVLIAGSYCSGKSTLTSDLGNDLPRAAVVPDECRDVLDTLPGVDWTDSDVRTYLVIRQVLIERASERQRPELTLVDGGVVSNIAHDRLLLDHAPDRTGLLAQLDFAAYDLALMCDCDELAIRPDGERFTDPAARQELDGHVRDVLDELKVPAIAISGTREARLRSAHEHIAHATR